MSTHPSPLPLRRLAALTALPLVLTLGACGTSGSGGGDDAAEGAGGPVDDAAGTTDSGAQATTEADAEAAGEAAPPLEIVTSFYPIEYLASRVAGEHAEVTTLTSAGVDPHDVELTPRQVASLSSADLVLYTQGMQPAVDQAVQSAGTARAVDLAPDADLLEVTHGGGNSHDDDDHDDDHDDHGYDDDLGHDHGPEDPHFWLDPERYATVAGSIAEQLMTIDPDNAAGYETNLAALTTELEALDQEFTDGLADCRSRDLVTTHEAFGYLAHRYGLDQIGITGITPESEPSPARLAEVTATVRELEVEAIFAEPILSDDIANTVARETGAQVLTLDPVEGITDASAGTSYVEIMRSNLDALREGLGCS